MGNLTSGQWDCIFFGDFHGGKDEGGELCSSPVDEVGDGDEEEIISKLIDTQKVEIWHSWFIWWNKNKPSRVSICATLI